MISEELLADYIDGHKPCSDGHHSSLNKCCDHCGSPYPCPTVTLVGEVRAVQALPSSFPVPPGQPVAGFASKRWAGTEREQFRKGLEKYGRSLSTHNGRNPYKDAREELVDLHQYLTQAEMEHEDTLIQLAHMTRHAVESRAELDDEYERRRDNVHRAWSYRRQVMQFRRLYTQCAAQRWEQHKACRLAEAERDAALQRVERLRAGLREIEFGNLDPSDDNDPAWSWCYHCDRRIPGHKAACPLAALIRDAEGT